MTQNVVTYTVEVVTDNSDGKLLPYLTATAYFETNRRDNVLQVANAALRWGPRQEQILPAFRSVSMGNPVERSTNNPQSQHQDTNTSGPPNYRQATLWVAQGSFVRPTRVRAGISDDTNTEVQGDEIREGLEVVAGEQQQTVNNTGTVNPFTPQIRPGRTSGQGQRP